MLRPFFRKYVNGHPAKLSKLDILPVISPAYKASTALAVRRISSLPGVHISGVFTRPSLLSEISRSFAGSTDSSEKALSISFIRYEADSDSPCRSFLEYER